MLDPYTGQSAEFLFTAKDNRGFPGLFDYYRGADGHVFIATIPNNLGDHYEGGYQKIPASETELADMAKVDAYRLDAVKRLVPSGSFLEIGPWIGLVAYSAKQAGYTVSALEMNQDCVDLLNRVGIAATQTGNPAMTLADSGRRYDVIGLWHSIEHVSEPWKLIDVAVKALNPGGLLVIAAPNPESAQLRALGKYWLHLDAPRHLHIMAAGSYEKIGHENGLVTVEKTSDDELGHILDHNGWVFEIHRRARNIPVVRKLATMMFKKTLAKQHRVHGSLDGAGFTLMMMRPDST